MLRFYVQAVGLALMGLAVGSMAPPSVIIAFTIMGATALVWVAVLKSRRTGSGAVENGMLITLCIFFGPMAFGLVVRAVLLLRS